MSDIYVGESELLDGLSEVVVPLLYFLLSGGEVRAEEDHGGGVVGDADGDRPLVPSGPTKSSFDVLDTDISAAGRENILNSHWSRRVSPDFACELRPDKDVETDPDQLVESDEAVALVPTQSLRQLQRPLLGILLTGVHDVLRIQVDHLFKPNGINIYRLLIFGWFIDVNQG